MTKKKVNKSTSPKIKWWKLKDPFLKMEFKRHVVQNVKSNHHQDLWANYREVILEVGENVLGKTSGKGGPKDKETWWWNEEVKKYIKEKKDTKKKWDKSNKPEDKEAYRKAKKEAKKAVAQAKAKYLSELYEKLETPEGEKNLYRLAKERDKASKDFTHIMQVKNKEGVVLKGEEDIKSRWKEYFNNLLNEENPRLPTEESLPNQGVIRDVDKSEVWEALKAMKNGKATGPDNIPIEVWKSLGADGLDLLLPLLNQVLEEERIPDDWRKSTIVPIYKEKGDIQDCGNYRGIKLMSHTMKLYERIIDKRLRKETCISDGQFGFMPGRSTMDAIFAIRQLLEKHVEKEKALYFVFIDLEKAYDRVPRDEIWRCLRIAGTPEKYVRVIQDMYDKATTQIKSTAGLTEHIPVKVGLHQGSALSPYLFDVIMEVLTDGVRREAPWCMLFADDVVLCGESAADIERELESWRIALEEKGLKINRTKTVQLNFGMENGDTISLDGVDLNKVDKFKYLGSTIDCKGELDCEIAHRINAAWMNWRKMSGVLCDRRMSVKMKGKIHKTVVRPAMMYGAETWALKKVHEKRLEVAEMRMLRWSCGVTRMDRIRNEVIRDKIKVTEVTKKIQERRLQWYGHVMRRDEDYVGKRVSRMEVEGRRARGRPKKRWEHCINKDLSEKGLRGNEVHNRGSWKLLTKNADPT
ncbi:hypothetical protein M8J77_006372 [Diaphorina citri]|nr:hypothetical protein M8J77_006372 [Diaphorina citri]